MAGQAPTGRLRRVIIRSVAVVIVGGAILAALLYHASTVDARPPQVDRFMLTQHLASDANVALTNASLEIVFSEPVDHAAAEAAFSIAPAVPGTFSWSGTTMVFTPARRLPLESSFSVSLAPGITDLAGNRMGAGGPFGFRTVGSPSVVATDPAASATDVALDSTIQITFSTLMDTASVQQALELTPSTDVDLRWSGERLTIVPRGGLQPGARYTVAIGTGATDLTGAVLASPLGFSFSTVASALQVTALVPQDTSQGIAVTTPVAVILDRPVDAGSLSGRMLTIEPAVAGSLAVTPLEGASGMTDAAPRILRFTPSGPLPANTTFTVTLSPGLRGTDGSQLAAPLEWTFTTGAPSTSLGNQITYLSARSGVTNLWAMNPDGSNQHQVSAELSPVTSYAVAPDGSTYVVGDGARLVEERADGSARRVLTEAGTIEFDPSYSPDGSRIVFGRADAATGAGLGLWTRPSSGGVPQQVALPSAAGSPSVPAAGSGSAPVVPAPLLRAPSYSPDGSRLAFIDTGGTVDILDLADGSLTTAAFHAVARPAWLPSSDGVLVSGLAAVTVASPWAGGILAPGIPAPPFTPTGLRLTAADRAEVQTVELDVGLATVRSTQLGVGATFPVVAAGGRVAYIVLGGLTVDAGRVWSAASMQDDSRQVALDEPAPATSVSFAPQPDTLVVALSPIVASEGFGPSPGTAPTPTPTLGPGSPTVAGIWLVDVGTGAARQLTSDGWLPQWLP